ncbi:MAG: hypothetical protein LLF89_09215, partial [Spirochaetaceae bacterium]|nr:hypothetical protein [Spirochaetaceae bacterium]
IQIETNAAEIMQRFHQLPGAVQSGVLKGLKRSLIDLEGQIKRRSGVNFNRGASGLAGRIASYAKPASPFGVDAAIGFRKTKAFPYELAQEFGAKASPGKAMAIPISSEAKALSYAGRGPRDFPGGLTLIKGSKNAVLIKDTKLVGGKMSGGEVQYVLVKSIPARLYFRRNVIAAIPEISRDIVEAEKESWRNL